MLDKKQSKNKLSKNYLIQKPKNIQNRLSSGFWSYDETGQYLRFIERYRKSLEQEQRRRDKKIFCIMSKAIISRSPAQCRSHHQKLLNKHKTLQTLIAYLKFHLSTMRAIEKSKKLHQQVSEKNLLIMNKLGLIQHQKNIQDIERNPIYIQVYKQIQKKKDLEQSFCFHETTQNDQIPSKTEFKIQYVIVEEQKFFNRQLSLFQEIIMQYD